MPLYFAYGRLMDPEEMAKRSARAKAIGPAMLEGFKFIVTKEGAPSVLKAVGCVTHGVLWDLPISGVAAVDGSEALFRRAQDKVLLNIRSGTTSRKALVYISCNRQKGSPNPKGFGGICEAAKHWELPELYQEELAGWAKRLPA
ncbi:gamma-glutamylcyclotransferase [Rhodobacteraceae bacterium RKSG542]|uniref:gamma-glutamylcyclotransferase family protein n=1 Tax=Pseudovibrio flavus TaxID=2529854 RepID=UPI0012BCBB11|nr:gamma-glutamylcyclotransferase family protein [Pseudovibrio flavus]MTI16413.1 gamma-glutamylcyclotransferase [Pseudovibrio flavus]